MERIIFILPVLSIYAVDIFFLVWVSFRFAAMGDIDKRKIFSAALSILLFSFLSFTALIQVPLSIKPLILLITVICILAIFVHVVDEHVIKAAVAGTFFIFAQAVLTIFLLRYFWNHQIIQQIRLIFIESLY